MIKRKILIGLCSLGTLIPLCTSATGEQIDWMPVNNCMGMAANFDSLLQDSSVVEYQAIPYEDSSVIDDGILQDYSSSYFIDYNTKERLITVLMGPKEPKGSTVDFKYSKKIGKVKLPLGFVNIRARIYENKYLIIFAEHNDYDRRVETVALVYDVSDGKISPFYYFTHTGKLIKLHEQDGKLFVITNTPLNQTIIQSFIKKDGNLPSIFPKFVEGVKYGLDPQEKVSVCRDFKYLQMPSKQMPSFWSIIVLNLNNLKITKDTSYFLGTISQFEFAEKSLYMTISGDGEETIVQKFGLEPKINLQRSVKLNSIVLNGGIYAKDMKLAFASKRASGKINQYLFIPFDSSFGPSAEKVLYMSEDGFDDVEYKSESIILKNREKMVEVAELANGGIATHAGIELPLKNHKYFLFGTNPLSMIDLSTSNSQIKFSLIQLDKAQGKFRQISKAKYPGEGIILGPISWNLKTKTLVIPIKMAGEVIFEGLKALQFSANGSVSEIMARTYGNSPMFETVKQLQDYSFVITNKLVDVFLPNNTTSKKIFKRG